MLAVAGLAVAASAQSTADKLVKVHIPFEFNFADKTFPAGDYSLTQPMQNLLVLRDSRDYAVAQVITIGMELPSQLAATKLKTMVTNFDEVRLKFSRARSPQKTYSAILGQRRSTS